MHKLWIKYCNHPNLKHIVNDFNDQELDLRVEMDKLPVGSTDWCMCEMKRHLLLAQCKLDCREHLHNTPTHTDRCYSCNMVYYIDGVTSTKVCKGCGVTVDVLIGDIYDFSTRDRYNGNRRHHYDSAEHFSQTLCDFTCTGSRRIPIEIYAYCRNVLGRGPHVSSHNVFLTLQTGGYLKYYLHKYEITNRLRGSPEFVVSSHELGQMRDVYKRYRADFIPFQQAHYIGTASKTGKPRIYWPTRYILKKICEEIGRPDLTVFIRGVCDKKKILLYETYWNKLKTFIDSTRPAWNRQNPSVLARPLKQSWRSRP